MALSCYLPCLRNGVLVLFIDLHTHTSYGSVCGYMTPDELIQQAKYVGLDGVCITEHNQHWDAQAIKRLRDKHDFLVIGGVEVDTAYGDILVFGMHESVANTYYADELRKQVDEAGGVMIAAHPFRNESPRINSSVAALLMTLEEGCRRPVFSFVDAVEVYNGMARGDEMDFTVRVANSLNLRGTGGSDAHSILGVGGCFTVFENSIKDEADLVEALKHGSYRPMDWRGRGQPGLPIDKEAGNSASEGKGSWLVL